MPSHLPERASLDYLKKLAKERLADLRRADPGAKLAAALLDVARDYGFASWRALKAEIDRRRDDRIARFFDACAGGNLETVRALLQAAPELARMPDPKAQYGGWTALHAAARDGRLDVVRLLLAHGADPNAREAGDNTYPLHWAAAHRHVEVVRALLDAGGDPHGAGDLHELDAIGWATYFHPSSGQRGERPEVAQLLVERGARHHAYSAMSLGDLELLRSVVEQDPDALERRMSRFEHRLTPLHFAMSLGRHDMLDLLIELGADLEATDANGHTPLATALLAGDRESVHRLQAAGAMTPEPSAPVATNLAGLADDTRRITPMLRVPDVRATLEWYVSLGFTERGRYEDAGTMNWALLSLGPAELMLNMGQVGEDPPVVLWFYVAHVTPVYEVLKARQLQVARSGEGRAAEFVQHLYQPPYGGWEFAVRDPNGFVLTFLGPA
jgi:ankyrin repeat protein/catechol 2,3-dioxygenase-like lactoylglutathione lyase family enzyme